MWRSTNVNIIIYNFFFIFLKIYSFIRAFGSYKIWKPMLIKLVHIHFIVILTISSRLKLLDWRYILIFGISLFISFLHRPKTWAFSRNENVVFILFIFVHIKFVYDFNENACGYVLILDIKRYLFILSMLWF